MLSYHRRRHFQYHSCGQGVISSSVGLLGGISTIKVPFGYIYKPYWISFDCYQTVRLCIVHPVPPLSRGVCLLRSSSPAMSCQALISQEYFWTGSTQSDWSRAYWFAVDSFLFCKSSTFWFRICSIQRLANLLMKVSVFLPSLVDHTNKAGSWGR